MFYQIKRMVLVEGNSHKIVEKFGGELAISKQPGYIGHQVLVKKVRRGDEEVLVMVQWESEQDWKNWEKHPDHIAGHKANIGKPKPDFIIESSQDVYEVKASK